MATITVAPIYLLKWPGRSGTLHAGFEGIEFGLDALCELDLQLDPPPLTLYLYLLLLDETPLFFKLRTNLGHINHFASVERPPIEDKGAHYSVRKGTLLQRTKTVSFCTHSRPVHYPPEKGHWPQEERVVYAYR